MIIELEDRDHLTNSKLRMIERKNGLQARVDIKITVIVNIPTNHDLDNELQVARADTQITVN